MTTIAYRYGMIAADTGISVGDSWQGEMTKIAKNGNGGLAGATGSIGFTSAFLDWFTNSKPHTDKPVAMDTQYGSDIGIIIYNTLLGGIEVHDASGVSIITAPYYAIGSGAPEALGAMFAGADAKMAVLAAMQHDAHTWGRVETLEM